MTPELKRSKSFLAQLQGTIERLEKERDEAQAKLREAEAGLREMGQRLQVERVDDLNAEIKALTDRVATAEAKCAEMRAFITNSKCGRQACNGKFYVADLSPNMTCTATETKRCEICEAKRHALSGDCGKGFVRAQKMGTLP